MNKDKRITLAINTLMDMEYAEVTAAFNDVDCNSVDDALIKFNIYLDLDDSDPVKEEMWEEEIAPVCDAILGDG